ncbi:MAG TPA: hypothetical protein VJ960_06435, partial [Oceanipulchritudo sp.]|nr:hypothetical protein [Oceanipulchritudo sp.]
MAESLAIKLDLPGGKWWMTLYADTGYQETTTPDLKVNGKVVELNWQTFKPPSEPSRVLKTSYRVYQGLFDTTDGLHIEFLGGTEEVRLLGFTVIPNRLPANELQQQLVEEIRQMGKYHGDGSLQPVHKKLQELRAAHPEDSFYDFWEQQTGLLLQAEDHFMKRGWEKYQKPTGLGIWGHLHQGIMLLDGLLNHPEATSSPLYERALFLRGRLLYWLGLQRHGPDEI